MEIALRHLVNVKQDDWAQYIGEIQLAQNNAVKDALVMAEFTTAEQNDKSNKAMDLQPGDYVYINFATKSKDGYTAAGIVSHKLGPQRAGPYKALDMAGPSACLVDVPKDWKIWPVISIRNLARAPATPDI